MATRELPKELTDLARALREASAKPTEAKANAIERRMEGLIRKLRAEQTSAGRRARTEKENEEIRAQAKEWASKGPSGDPGRRRKKGRGYKAYLAAGKSAKGWKRLSAKSRAKWARKGAPKRKTKKRSSARRDPGRHHRAHRVRAKRHMRRRHGRRHHRRPR